MTSERDSERQMANAKCLTTTCIVAIWCQVAFENALIFILFIYDMPETRQVVKLDNSSLGISKRADAKHFSCVFERFIADLLLVDYKAKLQFNKCESLKEKYKFIERR